MWQWISFYCYHLFISLDQISRSGVSFMWHTPRYIRPKAIPIFSLLLYQPSLFILSTNQTTLSVATYSASSSLAVLWGLPGDNSNLWWGQKSHVHRKEAEPRAAKWTWVISLTSLLLKAGLCFSNWKKEKWSLAWQRVMTNTISDSRHHTNLTQAYKKL